MMETATQATASQQQSTLMRFLHVVHQPLVELLELRELVSLLASCRQVRFHCELVACALSTNATTCHFYQKCDLDWCSFPTLRFKYSCTQTLHDHNPWMQQQQQPPLLTAAQRASLLSLAGLLAADKKLQSVYYSEKYGAFATGWQVIPFIHSVMLRSIDDDGKGQGKTRNMITEQQFLAALTATGGHLAERLAQPAIGVSESHLHFANLRWLASDADTQGVVVCDFCDAIAREIAKKEQEITAFWANRTDYLKQIDDALRADGYETESEEYYEKEYEFDTQNRHRYEYYNEAFASEGDSSKAQILMQEGRLGPGLCFVEEVFKSDPQLLGRAADEGYTQRLCPQVYRPLHALWTKAGATHRRHSICPVDRTISQYEDRRQDIRKVEMTGGLFSHGFFAAG